MRGSYDRDAIMMAIMLWHGAVGVDKVVSVESRWRNNQVIPQIFRIFSIDDLIGESLDEET